VVENDSGGGGGVTGMEGSESDFTAIDSGPLTSQVLKILPYSLTSCQDKAIRVIFSRLLEPVRMERLVQGDVGSGKTLVAVFALIRAVEAGRQGVFLAPTELLAQQHCDTIAGIFDKLTKTTGGRKEDGGKTPTVRLITGSLRGNNRVNLLEEISAGKVDVLVGTHALLGEEVLESFPALGLAIIDEEQRFGVHQRNILSRTNVLYTTATPIPRSLSLVRVGGCSVDVDGFRGSEERREGRPFTI